MSNSTAYHFLSYYPLACVLLCGYAVVLGGISFFKGLANLLKTLFANDRFHFYYFVKFIIAGAVVCRYYSLYDNKDSTLPLILADPAQASLAMVFSLCLPLTLLMAADSILSKIGPPEMLIPKIENNTVIEKLKDIFDDLTHRNTPAVLKKIAKKNNNPLALIIENGKPTRQLVKRSLESENFNVIYAESGGEGLSLAAALYPDFILLDSKLPDMDGWLVLSSLREWTQAPVIILTDQTHERIQKHDTGADYYLTRRFKTKELKDLIGVALLQLRQKSQRGDVSVYHNSDLKLDRASRVLTVRRKEVHLTPHEYHLLSFLISHAGRVVTPKMIKSEFWGKHMDEDALKRCVHQLRNKIEYDPVEPRYILNEPGEGYRLEHR